VVIIEGIGSNLCSLGNGVKEGERVFSGVIVERWRIKAYNKLMSTDEKLQILSGFPLFADVSTKTLRALAESTYPKTFQKSDVILFQDADSHHAYFIYEGVVSTYRTTLEGHYINIDILGTKDMIGEMGLINNKPNTVSAQALLQTETLVLSQNDFERLVHEYPTLAFIFFELFASTVTYFDNYLEELFSKNLHERTMIVLTYLAPYFPNNEITLSQEEIADLLWATR
jgi:CRP-like cAMP-binding protein